jgi:hypothetical protein
MSVVCLLATIVLLCWSLVVRPSGAQCPPRWYVNGVRPSGEYECRPAPGGDPDSDGTFGRPDITPFDPSVIVGRVRCRHGQAPIVIDERTVACATVPR